MIIEILEEGGIYGYFKNNECLYVGKTERPFYIRKKEHLEDGDELSKRLQIDNSIDFKIILDCRICHYTSSQLDYLETCFINILHPKYNTQKINTPISFQNKTFASTTNTQIIQLTKKERVVLQMILESKKEELTKAEIRELIRGLCSEKTIQRTIIKFCDLEILFLKYFDKGKNSNLYLINQEKVKEII